MALTAKPGKQCLTSPVVPDRLARSHAIQQLPGASGTQADAVASPSNGEDFGWNAVWDSAVKIVNDGWIVEMKIPYRALRFSNQEVQKLLIVPKMASQHFAI